MTALAIETRAPLVCRVDPDLGADDLLLCPQCGDAHWTDGASPPSPVGLDDLPMAPEKRKIVEALQRKLRTARIASVWEEQRTRLGQLAHRALARRLDGRKALVVCIEVDSSWRPLVDLLMPGFDWQAVRARGERPWARGSVPGLIAPLCELLPGMAKDLRKGPPKGLFHALVMVNGHASIYLLEPQPEPS